MQTARNVILVALTTFLLASCCDKEKISANTDALYSSDAKLRNDGALALARCGDAAKNAVPRLIQLMYDENVGVQSSAAYALRKIDTKPARAALQVAEEQRAARRAKGE